MKIEIVINVFQWYHHLEFVTVFQAREVCCHVFVCYYKYWFSIFDLSLRNSLTLFPLSTIMIFDFGVVPIVWYFVVFHLFIYYASSVSWRVCISFYAGDSHTIYISPDSWIIGYLRLIVNMYNIRLIVKPNNVIKNHM